MKERDILSRVNLLKLGLYMLIFLFVLAPVAGQWSGMDILTRLWMLGCSSIILFGFFFGNSPPFRFSVAGNWFSRTVGYSFCLFLGVLAVGGPWRRCCTIGFNRLCLIGILFQVAYVSLYMMLSYYLVFIRKKMT